MAVPARLPPSAGSPRRRRCQQPGRIYLGLPVRIRGVALGLAVLAISPLVALAGAQHDHSVAHLTPAGYSAPTVVIVQQVSRLLPVRDPELQRASEPEPAATPDPTPAPVARHVAPLPPPGPPPAPGTIEAIIQAAATKWGVSYAWMLKIARCESGLNPRAYNPAGPYIGLFQFLPSTFKAHGGTDIYDPVQQADITGFMLSHGGAGAWGCA